MADANTSAARANPRLSTVAGRKALAPRRDPYFEPIAGVQSASIGFRKIGEVGTEEGTWIVRIRHDRTPTGTAAYKFESLGAQKDHHAATKAAHAWIELFLKGFTDTEITVRKLCADYADAVEKTRVDGNPPRPKTAKGMRSRYKEWVDKRPIGAIKLTDLKGHAVRDWRQTLEGTPDKHGKARTGMSINRIMSDLRSALNWAVKCESIATDAAWKEPLRKIANADNARRLYLTWDERTALRDACPPCLRALIEATIRLPLRPGPLAALRVVDFRKATAMLTISSEDKGHSGRELQLSEKTAEFFAKQCEGKQKEALIFPDPEGEMWTARTWGEGIRKAREQVFAEGTEARQATLYTFRHCAITDLLRGHAPAIDVAQCAGTSIAQIDKHYAQHIPAHAAMSLAILEKGL